MQQSYRAVKSVPGLSVTSDAQFSYNGKPKKAVYATTVTGRRATVRIMIMWGGKNHYWQAAKLVAEAWKYGYEDGDRITYKDGDCLHFIEDVMRITHDKATVYWKQSFVDFFGDEPIHGMTSREFLHQWPHSVDKDWNMFKKEE